MNDSSHLEFAMLQTIPIFTPEPNLIKHTHRGPIAPSRAALHGSISADASSCRAHDEFIPLLTASGVAEQVRSIMRVNVLGHLFPWNLG